MSFAFHPSEHWSHNITLHYTYGYGYYSELKPKTKFAKFGLTFTDSNGNFVKKSDFVRLKGLSQHTYGIVYTSNYKDESWDVTGGLNLQQFRGSHFGYLTYIKNEEADALIVRVARTISTMTPRLISMTTAASSRQNITLQTTGTCLWTLQTTPCGVYGPMVRNDRFYKVANGYKNQLLDNQRAYDFVIRRQV